MNLLSYMMAFGLATGAGSRAALVLFLLGCFHHTEYFDLAANYEWIGSLPVLLVTGFLSLFEFLADLFPNVSELNDMIQYFPGLIAGFLSLAAVTGSVDSNLLHLVASGILGGTVSTGVRYIRNSVATVTRDASESVGFTPHAIRAVMESGVAATSTVAIFLFPIFAVVSIAVLVGGFIFMKRHFERNQKNTLQEDIQQIPS